MLAHFIINIKNSHLLISSPISLEKYLGIGKLSSSLWWREVFQNFKLHQELWIFEFYYWQQTLSVVFLEAVGLFYSFLRKYLPNTKLNDHFVSHSFKSKLCFMDKSDSSANKPNSHTSAFPRDSHRTSVCSRSDLCICPSSSHRMLTICMLKVEI